MYEYKIKEILKVYDGDTITVSIDLGFNTFRTEVLRFANIDTPEIRGEERPEGLIAREYVASKLYLAVEESIDITVKTEKDNKGKYGRYIAEIFIGDDEISLNEHLVNEGLAEFKEY